jgi:hypothetical protein
MSFISNQNPTFYKQFEQMIFRVFKPSQAIRRAEVYIDNTDWDTRRIGIDPYYHFATRIKDTAGNSIALSPDDFYVRVEITPIEYKTHLILKIIETILKKIFSKPQSPQPLLVLDHMPSSLFRGAKENDTISYQMDDQPVELVLKQQNHPNHPENFEGCFSTLQSTISKQKASLLCHFTKDYPPQQIQRAEISIVSNRVGGLIGNDSHDEFQKHITIDGNPIKLSSEDFYVSIEKKPLGHKLNKGSSQQLYPVFEHLPSCLFKGAKENDTISFERDGQPVELIMKQQNNPTYKDNFEKSYKLLQDYISYNRRKGEYSLYQFDSDIPSDILRLGTIRVLSKNAVVSIGGSSLEAVTKENLEHFESYLKAPVCDIQCKDEDLTSYTVIFYTAGYTQADFSYLIDNNYIFLGAEKSYLKEQQRKYIRSTSPPNLFLEVHTQNIIDPAQVTISLSNRGVVTLTLPYKKSSTEQESA